LGKNFETINTVGKKKAVEHHTGPKAYGLHLTAILSLKKFSHPMSLASLELHGHWEKYGWGKKPPGTKNGQT
jgi:hypothetical protein